MTVRETAEALTTARYRSPKTLLGFFAILVGILMTGATAVVGLLASHDNLHHLVVPVLLFAGAVLVLVLVGVFITAWKDPTILLLGEVTGEVYIQNRKLTLGDSTAGEFTEIILTPSLPSQPELPEATGSEESR